MGQAFMTLVEIHSVWAEEGGIRIRICESPDFPGQKVIQIINDNRETGEPASSQIIGQARVTDYRAKRLAGALL